MSAGIRSGGFLSHPLGEGGPPSGAVRGPKWGKESGTRGTAVAKRSGLFPGAVLPYAPGSGHGRWGPTGRGGLHAASRRFGSGGACPNNDGRGGALMPSHEPALTDQHERDEADLAKFGYKQELKRTLGVFSSFAVAFSFLSPSTVIFALFYLALTVGGDMLWSWSVVVIGQ